MLFQECTVYQCVIHSSRVLDLLHASVNLAKMTPEFDFSQRPESNLTMKKRTFWKNKASMLSKRKKYYFNRLLQK